MANQEQGLRDIVAQLESAWNQKDSVAWANLFAEDADFIHIFGGHYTGRSSVEQGHRTIFDTIYKGSSLKLTVEKIRMAGPDVAIIFLFGELTTAQPGLPPRLNTRPTMVLQRQDAGWQIVAFQNTTVTPEGPPVGNALADMHPFKGQAGPITE